MSTPKPARLNPRVKISRTGRPYIDVEDWVESQLNRIEKPQEEGPPTSQQDQGNVNDNGSGHEPVPAE